MNNRFLPSFYFEDLRKKLREILEKRNKTMGIIEVRPLNSLAYEWGWFQTSNDKIILLKWVDLAIKRKINKFIKTLKSLKDEELKKIDLLIIFYDSKYWLIPRNELKEIINNALQIDKESFSEFFNRFDYFDNLCYDYKTKGDEIMIENIPKLAKRIDTPTLNHLLAGLSRLGLAIEEPRELNKGSAYGYMNIYLANNPSKKIMVVIRRPGKREDGSFQASVAGKYRKLLSFVIFCFEDRSFIIPTAQIVKNKKQSDFYAGSEILTLRLERYMKFKNNFSLLKDALEKDGHVDSLHQTEPAAAPKKIVSKPATKRPKEDKKSGKHISLGEKPLEDKSTKDEEEKPGSITITIKEIQITFPTSPGLGQLFIKALTSGLINIGGKE